MQPALNITVHSYRDRVGQYRSEQAAIEAAMEYSRDTERSVTLDYNDGTYSYTMQRRDGEWILSPIFREAAEPVEHAQAAE